jgi:DNA polymerase sigma
MEYHHISTKLSLHRALLDFAWWTGLTSEEKHIRLIVVRRFRNAINALWPEAMVVCHGSTETYLPTGEIDIVVLHEPGDIDLLLSQLQ